MNPIVNNRYVDALLKLMLLSAVLHMVVLAIYFIVFLDGSRLNFFKIINIDLFFPRLVTDNFTNVYSLSFGAVLYVSIYYFFTHQNNIKK